MSVCSKQCVRFGKSIRFIAFFGVLVGIYFGISFPSSISKIFHVDTSPKWRSMQTIVHPCCDVVFGIPRQGNSISKHVFSLLFSIKSKQLKFHPQVKYLLTSLAKASYSNVLLINKVVLVWYCSNWEWNLIQNHPYRIPSLPQ